MGPLAGLVSELVRNGQAIARDSEKLWFSGVLGPHDLLGLFELHRKDDRNLQDAKKKVAFDDPETSVIGNNMGESGEAGEAMDNADGADVNKETE